MLVEHDADVVCDFRVSNGRPPKFEESGEIVDEFIKDKVAVDDRWYAQSIDEEEDVLVNLSISNSDAELYRQCVSIAEKRASTFNQKNGYPTLAALKYDVWCKIEFCVKTTRTRIIPMQFISSLWNRRNERKDESSFRKIDEK